MEIPREWERVWCSSGTGWEREMLHGNGKKRELTLCQLCQNSHHEHSSFNCDWRSPKEESSGVGPWSAQRCGRPFRSWNFIGWFGLRHRRSASTISPRYLHDLNTVQPSRSTRSSTLVTLLQPSVDSSLKITNCSIWCVAYLTCGTSFLLLLVFLISSILHHQSSSSSFPSSYILDSLLTFLLAFSTIALKLSFSQSLSLHSHLSLPRADFRELWPFIVWQSLAAVVLVIAAD